MGLCVCCSFDENESGPCLNRFPSPEAALSIYLLAMPLCMTIPEAMFGRYLIKLHHHLYALRRFQEGEVHDMRDVQNRTKYPQPQR